MPYGIHSKSPTLFVDESVVITTNLDNRDIQYTVLMLSENIVFAIDRTCGLIYLRIVLPKGRY